MPVEPADLGQRRHQVRFDWGGAGLRALLAGGRADVAAVVVVDVLSFGTAVDVAVGRGARVLPLPWRDERALRAAHEAGAVLATGRSTTEWSLSPSSLSTLASGTLFALPSPNGATLCAEAAETVRTVFVGCLRNARAVARAARAAAGSGDIAVLAAGERADDGPVRFAVEDLLGAGAVLDALGDGSPEAEAAAASFRGCRDRLGPLLVDCVSGRELAGLGHADDVRLAARLDVSGCAPHLRDGVLIR